MKGNLGAVCDRRVRAKRLARERGGVGAEACGRATVWCTRDAVVQGGSEALRAANYPLARWYLRPAAGWFAAKLAGTRVRPWHLTCLGLVTALVAAGILCWQPAAAAVAGGLVLVYWFFDRADGQLARRQGTASAWGTWLDGNVDELADVVLHTAVAAALAAQHSVLWPWWVLIAFVAGKYLFMYGLMFEQQIAADARVRGQNRSAEQAAAAHWVRRAYHLPGNADVRVHLLALAIVTGCLGTELAVVAAYYNLRWMIRYGLVVRRLRGVA